MCQKYAIFIYLIFLNFIDGALYPGTYYPIAFPDQSFTMSTLRLSFLNGKYIDVYAYLTSIGARTVAFLGMTVSSGYYKNIIDATIIEMNSTLGKL
jgi:hypothetical protein